MIKKVNTPVRINEIEWKFDIPLGENLDQLAEDIIELFKGSNWGLSSDSQSNRTLRYIDRTKATKKFRTPYPVLIRNQTIREKVKLKNGEPSSIFYEFKWGSGIERMEESYKTEGTLSLTEVERLIPKDFYHDAKKGLYLPLDYSVNAKSSHRKLKFVKDGITIETKIDKMVRSDGLKFNELEGEVKDPNGKHKKAHKYLRKMQGQIYKELGEFYGLLPYVIQKYTRFVNLK